jgi:hypothetical protein
MKVKGINVFEQHLEKMVLGGALLIALGIVGWHVVSTPKAKVGPNEVAFPEVDAALDRKAKQIATKLEGTGSIELPAEDQIKLAESSFEERRGKAVSPVGSLARTSPSFNAMLVKTGGAKADVWYYEPKVPVLRMEGVQETADALTVEGAKEAAKASPAIAARFGSEITQPKDVVWTTPVARIDLKKLRAELSASDASASPPRSAIPGIWYQDRAYVLDVVFERREKRADGSWGEPAEVPVFASRDAELTFRGRIPNPDAMIRDEVFQLLGIDDNQEEILQPTFYETVNQAFVSPELLMAASSGGDAAPGEDAGIIRRRMQLQTQLTEKRRRADSLIADLNKLGGPWDDEKERKTEQERKEEERRRKEEERKSGGDTPGGRGPGGGPGGGGSMSGKANANADADAKEAKRKATERRSKTAQLRRVEADIAKLQAELGPGPDAGGNKAAAAPVPTLASKDELLVWGHDLEVEPGSTYQYRSRIRAYNPFFARGNLLVDAQRDKGLAAACVMESPASDWSQEIRVSPSVRFFLTRANAGDGAMGLGSAQFEIFRLVDGKWRRAEMSVQPGERIGRMDDRAAGGPIDFTTEHYLVDVVEDIAGRGDARGELQAQARDRRPGIVVIASSSRPGHEIRIPAVDSDDPDRAKLRAQAAASSASAASTGGTK